MGIGLEDAARKAQITASRLREAESGDTQLTFRQAQLLAKAYRRPLAAFYLSEPPDEPELESQFRRLPGTPSPPWPPEMRGLIREVRDRQEVARELYEVLEAEPPWAKLPGLPANADAEALAEVVRELLGVSLAEQLAWRDRAGFAPLRAWIDAVERLGPIVIQDSSVPLALMRGFVSPDDNVPAIVVNTADDPRSRAFTVLHELGHLLRTGATDAWRQDEPYCNSFAASILMPAEPFRDYYRAARAAREPLEAVDETALSFGVTPAAAAIRIEHLQLESVSTVESLRRAISGRGHPARSRGGNYYLNVITWYGPAFIDLVFSAVDAGRLSTLQAARTLGGVKIPNQEKLRAELAERASR